MFRILAAVILAFAATAAAASAQTPADSRLKRIADTKVLKIAYRPDAAPFSFLSDQKVPVGYSIDLCRLVVLSIGKQLGIADLNAEWVPTTLQARFDVVAGGQADMECGSSTITLGRLKQVDFSSVTFLETTGIVVRADAGLANATALTGRKVAVIAGTSNERGLVELKARGRLDLVLVPVKDRAEGIALLEGGKVEGYASDKLLLAGATYQQTKVKMVILPDDLSFEPYGIVLPRGDWAFRLAVNTALAEIYRGALVLDIFKKWFDPVGLRPTPFLAAAFQLGALPE